MLLKRHNLVHRAPQTAILCLLVAVALLVASCRSSGPAGNPLTREFTWFDYAGAGDVRRACAAGERDRLRFIYNARWGHQVRTYDVVRSATGEGAILNTRVFAGGPLEDFNLSRPLAGFSGASDSARIDEAAYRTLTGIADDASLPQDAASGQALRSDDYHWVLASCTDGRFRYRAWRMQQTDLNALPFVAALARLAPVAGPIPPARRLALQPWPPTIRSDRHSSAGDPEQAFRLELTDNGVVGTAR